MIPKERIVEFSKLWIQKKVKEFESDILYFKRRGSDSTVITYGTFPTTVGQRIKEAQAELDFYNELLSHFI